MNTPTYRQAIEWVALNDGSGDDEAFKPGHCAEIVSACMIADLFGVDPDKVGRAIARLRKKLKKEGKL